MSAAGDGWTEPHNNDSSHGKNHVTNLDTRTIKTERASALSVLIFVLKNLCIDESGTAIVVPDFFHWNLCAVQRTMSSVPAAIRAQPMMDLGENCSWRITDANTMVITTLSLSMGTTLEVSPSWSAL